jgi:hypothetical protein
MVARRMRKYWYKSSVGVISYEAVFDISFACAFGFSCGADGAPYLSGTETSE